MRHLAMYDLRTPIFIYYGLSKAVLAWHTIVVIISLDPLLNTNTCQGKDQRMIKRTFCLVLSVTLITPTAVFADTAKPLTTPSQGVLCDQYICADENGVSIDLTKKYLGEAVANTVASQGDFDVTEFTFSNGIFCDSKEKACHIDRYFNADGTRSAVDPHYTAKLFGR